MRYLLLIVFFLSQSIPAQTMRAHFIDIGQGDATLKYIQFINLAPFMSVSFTTVLAHEREHFSLTIKEESIFPIMVISLYWCVLEAGSQSPMRY